MIVSDSVFSTNGAKADINRLVNLKQRYNAILIIDASHSLGLNLFECHADIDIVTSSLSKAWEPWWLNTKFKRCKRFNY